MYKKMIACDNRLANVFSVFNSHLNCGSHPDEYSHYCVGSIMSDLISIHCEYDLEPEFDVALCIDNDMSHIVAMSDDIVGLFFKYQGKGVKARGIYEFIKKDGCYTLNQIY